MTPEDACFIGQVVRNVVLSHPPNTDIKILFYVLLSEKSLFPYDVDTIYECLQTMM
jgi:hypothetical protein